MAVYEYDTVRYPSRSLMCGARRDHYVALLNQGMNYTQAHTPLACLNVPGKHGETGVGVLLAGTSNPVWAGIVMTWTGHNQSARDI